MASVHSASGAVEQADEMCDDRQYSSSNGTMLSCFLDFSWSGDLSHVRLESRCYHLDNTKQKIQHFFKCTYTRVVRLARGLFMCGNIIRYILHTYLDRVCRGEYVGGFTTRGRVGEASILDGLVWVDATTLRQRVESEKESIELWYND